MGVKNPVTLMSVVLNAPNIGNAWFVRGFGIERITDGQIRVGEKLLNKGEEMKQKRWLLMEVPEKITRILVDCIGDGKWRTSFEVTDKILNGPVELVQEACEKAGVEFREPSKGEWFFGAENKWWHSGALPGARAVIPATEPGPCENCQNARPFSIKWDWKGFDKICRICGRPKSEWTYAEPEWAGVGSGIM